MDSESAKILPVDEHLKLLLTDEFRDEPCENGPDEKFELPPWFDEKKYKRGQKYIRENIFAQFTCTFCGLISILAVPSVLNILMKTQKSHSFTGAYRRYISTIFHVHSWYMEDLMPNTDAWKSLMTVRNRHYRASKSSRRKSDAYISQRDMSLTQFCFLAIGFIYPNKIGMKHDNQDDVEAYIFFWRTIGYMLGISDEYNICRPSLEETRTVFDIVRREVFCYHLKYPPEYFYFMISAILQSMWYYSPFLSEGSFIYFTMWLMGVDGYSYHRSRDDFFITLTPNTNNLKRDDILLYTTNNNIDNGKQIYNNIVKVKLGWYNRLLLRLLHIVHYLIKTRLGKKYFNRQTYLTIFLLKKFPFLSFPKFGISTAYVNMFEEDRTYFAKLKTNIEMLNEANY